MFVSLFISIPRPLEINDSLLVDPYYAEIPPDPNDTQLGHYLIAAWAKVCQATGPEFKPYLPVVMPLLLATAGAKADLLLYREFISQSILAFIVQLQ